MKQLLYKFLGFSAYVINRFIYGSWSRAYRFIFESRYKNLPNSRPWTTIELLSFYKSCTWTSDAIYGILDIMSKPEKFYKTHKGDCDEYAVFAANVLNPNSMVGVLSVQWYDSCLRGHHVCVIKRNGLFYHIGNWGLWGAYANLDKLAASIVPEYGKILSWSLRKGDSSLKWLSGKII